MSEPAKILIADDEQDCIDFVREALVETPWEVLSALDGEEAVKVAREQSPQLIILDIQMPKLNGFEAFAKLKEDENLKSVPVIMLTGVSEKTGIGFSGPAMGEYLGAEPDAYLEKPLEPVVLRQTIGRLLR